MHSCVTLGSMCMCMSSRSVLEHNLIEGVRKFRQSSRDAENYRVHKAPQGRRLGPTCSGWSSAHVVTPHNVHQINSTSCFLDKTSFPALSLAGCMLLPVSCFIHPHPGASTISLKGDYLDLWKGIWVATNPDVKANRRRKDVIVCEHSRLNRLGVALSNYHNLSTLERLR